MQPYLFQLLEVVFLLNLDAQNAYEWHPWTSSQQKDAHGETPPLWYQAAQKRVARREAAEKAGTWRSPKVRAAGRLRTWEETNENWLLDEDSESSSISSGSSISSSVFGGDDVLASNSTASSEPENILSSIASNHDGSRVHSNTIAGKKTGLRKGRHGFKSDSSDGTSDFSASSKSTELLRGQGYRLPPSSSSSSFADTWDGESAPLPHRTPAEIAAAIEGSAPLSGFYGHLDAMPTD